MKEIMKKKNVLLLTIIVLALTVGTMMSKKNETITTSGTPLNTKKIEWGIKRNDNHNQPDLGKVNKELIDKYNGLAMGNANSKKVYLTFDMGYEADI